MMEDRYDRQRRLSEVGIAGQARIEAHEARIGAGPGASIALAYLVRAGLRRVSVERGLRHDFPQAGAFAFAGPAAVAAGAHQALREIRAALAMEGTR